MSRFLSLEKVWFILSVAVLSFGYGFASHAWDLFPKDYVEQAWKQTRAIMGASFRTDYSHARTFKRHGAQRLDSERIQPGLTAITSWWSTSEGPQVGVKLIDREGNVLHRWLIDRREVFQGELGQRKDPRTTDIQGSVLLPDGDVVFNLEYVGMARLNSCGNVLWTLTEGTHHSIAQAEDGSFWVPGISQERRVRTKKHPDLPGLGPIWLDRILRVSKHGKVLRDITVIDILYSNNLERHLFKHERTRNDVTHLNDVEPLSPSLADEYPLFEAGDLLVSLRHLDLVFVFDPASMEVKWHESAPFIHQHDPDFLGNGWIGVFDNNQVNNYVKRTIGRSSRIVALQPHTDSTKILFEGQHLDRFYTGHRGKWQALDNGNMLLTEEATGRVIEVSPDGNPVWEWVHRPLGSRVPSVTKATRHALTRQEVASWSCSSID
jgi:hypothetical protein